MAVKKKVSSSKSHDGILELSPELLTIREMISTLPPEGEDMNQTTEASAPESPKAEATSKVKKVTKKPAAKKTAPAKKTSMKKKAAPAKKTAPVAKKAAANETTLSEICKSIKMEPRKARRILRTADVKNPGRWAWAAAADVAKIKKVLAEAA